MWKPHTHTPAFVVVLVGRLESGRSRTCVSDHRPFVALGGRGRAELPADWAVERTAVDVLAAPGALLGRPAMRRAAPRESAHEHCAQEPEARHKEREAGGAETAGDHI